MNIMNKNGNRDTRRLFPAKIKDMTPEEKREHDRRRQQKCHDKKEFLMNLTTLKGMLSK